MSCCTGLTRGQSNALYAQVLADHDEDAMRKLCQDDLFFLLTVACNRKDIDRDWLYDRCREVEAEPDGKLDCWAREHYKSTIITFGHTLKDILNDPSVTVGIFSHTRPIAKAFMQQIKTELENNEFLKALFDDILFANPQKESPAWSLDGGLVVKRSTNPKEKTVEAWGLVDGQPVSKHFSLLVYDDVVTQASVTSPDMIRKTTEAWGLSLSLGAAGGTRRIIGTRYHFNDTYKFIMDNGAAVPRIYPATEDGTMDGKPVLFDQETWEERKKGGSYVTACQYLQNPVADDAQGFREEWVEYYQPEHFDGRFMNHYLLCDPANEKKKANDYTVMIVVALANDGNYYLVDGLRDRLNLTERTAALFRFHRKYNPVATGYERYGMQSDIEHIRGEMERNNYRFNITELGGQTPKNDRIRKLVPLFENRRFYFPPRLHFVDECGHAPMIEHPETFNRLTLDFLKDVIGEAAPV